MGDFAREYKDVGLGKGAWCCDERKEILPEDEARVFEEIPTYDFVFKHVPDVPTVPRRQNMTHVACWFDGCRYRVEFDIARTARELRQKLWEGGMGRGDEMTTGARRKVERAEDIVIIYSGRRMLDLEKPVREYDVPTGCKVLLAIPQALLDRAELGFGPENEDYWA